MIFRIVLFCIFESAPAAMIVIASTRIFERYAYKPEIKNIAANLRELIYI